MPNLIQEIQDFPNLTYYGYEIKKLLGQNLDFGRSTFQAIELTTGNPVVIKLFQFLGNSWSGLDALKREASILKGLSHPSIPQFFDFFEYEQGFCLIQEYIEAESLVNQRIFSREQVYAIALQLLEILKYLQNQAPPIIHCNIKPSNILVDHKLQVYLIDFGFSRFGEGSLSASSIMTGTLGFIAPEAVYNQVTLTSDLYSLGVTLLCLLKGVQETEVESVINHNSVVKLLELDLNEHALYWFNRLISPSLQGRYQNAAIALRELHQVNFDQSDISESLAVSPTLGKKLDKIGQPSSQQINYGTERLNKKGCPILSGFNESQAMQGRIFEEDKVSIENFGNLKIQEINRQLQNKIWTEQKSPERILNELKQDYSGLELKAFAFLRQQYDRNSILSVIFGLVVSLIFILLHCSPPIALAILIFLGAIIALAFIVERLDFKNRQNHQKYFRIIKTLKKEPCPDLTKREILNLFQEAKPSLKKRIVAYFLLFGFRYITTFLLLIPVNLSFFFILNFTSSSDQFLLEVIPIIEYFASLIAITLTIIYCGLFWLEYQLFRKKIKQVCEQIQKDLVKDKFCSEEVLIMLDYYGWMGMVTAIVCTAALWTIGWA